MNCNIQKLHVEHFDVVNCWANCFFFFFLFIPPKKTPHLALLHEISRDAVQHLACGTVRTAEHCEGADTCLKPYVRILSSAWILYCRFLI